MFDKYSSEAVKGISVERTKKGNRLIKGLGGEVISLYAPLGEQDLVLIVEFPGIEETMKASVGLAKLTGISFATSPAVLVEVFDKMAAGV